MQIKNVARGPERALLVGVERGRNGVWDVESSLVELSQLADTAGAEVVDRVVARISKPNPAFFIGKGKAQELAQICQGKGIELVIFDEDLSPVQLRNLEDSCGVRIVDRTQLILDIFARRARTREAQAQVELAQLRYMLPRLTRQWLHLSRQEGGVGTRGPGEKQLEVDRRRAKARLVKLGQDLRGISSERLTQRKKRERFGLLTVSIIGYTNAGKTTLFNRLTESENLAENRLFATLDSTRRRVALPGFAPVLVSDTVGFIRKLPHHLIESFKATLEEVTRSDLLIHVLDVSDPLADEKYDVVMEVLGELHAQDIPRVTALNKIDALEVPRAAAGRRNRDEAFPVSAKCGQGVELLISRVREILERRLETLRIFLPHRESKWVSLLHREGVIVGKKFDSKGVFLEVKVGPHLVSELMPFRVS